MINCYHLIYWVGLERRGGDIINNKTIFSYILIILPLLISTFFVFNTNKLIPDGYELAVDGYVISKTLMLIFSLYLLFKLGFYLIKQKNS